MFVLARAVTYATVFIGFFLVALPSQVLSAAGVSQPSVAGPLQFAGLAIAGGGVALTLVCLFTFVFVGKGTPAPFDPPRQLVVSGPYRRVRNPMYLGAAIAMSGAALFYESPALAAYVGAFLVATHLFVIGYEEPTLRRLFDGPYDRYCRQVPRWLV
jgi:protein-S-isoprenylcysteine O-methyltransferase Ste14